MQYYREPAKAHNLRKYKQMQTESFVPRRIKYNLARGITQGTHSPMSAQKVIRRFSQLITHPDLVRSGAYLLNYYFSSLIIANSETNDRLRILYIFAVMA